MGSWSEPSADADTANSQTWAPPGVLEPAQSALHLAPVGIAQCDGDGRITLVNAALCSLLGHSREELLQRTWQSVLHPDDRRGCDDLLSRRLGGDTSSFTTDLRCVHKDGSAVWVELAATVVSDGAGHPALTIFAVTDATRRRRMESRLRAKREVLEMIASNTPLPDILDVIVQIIESHWPSAIGSIVLVDPDGTVRIGAGRGLPAGFRNAIEGKKIGPMAGSCGTAAYRGEPVIVADIATDPLWAAYRDVALTHGLRACWSLPVFSSTREILATLAIYYREPRSPGADEAEFGRDVAVYLAEIAIERARNEAALKEYAERLANVDRRKDEFLATLGHEFRNPLAAILTAVRILQVKGPPVPELQRARAVIDRQVKHLHRLVDDLLDVARIARGQVHLKHQALDLRGVVRDALDMTHHILEARGHSVLVSLPDETLVVNGDAARLVQVVANLLTNAAKYTSAGGSIWVALNTEGHHAVVRVRDTGVGIRAEHLTKVFDLFEQVERERDGAHGGLGVGLAVAHGLVELHGGTLTATSPGPGKGSEFIIRLPIP
jgi:PAS domain S-box-containing protein